MRARPPAVDGTGVYARGERWPPQLAAFEAHWRPFLRSDAPDDAARRAALEAVARALIGGSDGA